MKTIEQLMLDDTFASTGVRDSIFYHMLNADRISASSLCTLINMTGIEVFVDYLGEYKEPGVIQDTVDVTINFDPGIDRGLWSVTLFGLGIWDDNTGIRDRAMADRDRDAIIQRLKQTVYLDFQIREAIFEQYLVLNRIQPTAEKIKATALIASRFNKLDYTWKNIFKELH